MLGVTTVVGRDILAHHSGRLANVQTHAGKLNPSTIGFLEHSSCLRPLNHRRTSELVCNEVRVRGCHTAGLEESSVWTWI